MTMPTHALFDVAGTPSTMCCAVFAEKWTDDAGVEHDRYPADRLRPLPAAWHTRPMHWSGTAFADDVDGERARLIEVNKLAWAAARLSSVAVPGIGTVQINEGVTQVLTSALAGAAAAQAFGLPFLPLKLILLDNSISSLNGAQVVATATVVAAAIQATTDTYTARRTAIETATTLEALWAVMAGG